MITQLKGVKTIYLFAPKNRKYLYAKGDKSQIDFFTDNLLNIQNYQKQNILKLFYILVKCFIFHIIGGLIIKIQKIHLQYIINLIQYLANIYLRNKS